MNLAQLEEMLRELLQALQVVMQSGEELPDEVQMEIAQTLSRLSEAIQRARGVSGGVSPPSGPPIEPSMPSSNVAGFAYDDKTGRLFVRFLGKHPNRNGPIYSYENVPPVMFDLFRRGAVPARTDGHNKWGRWWKGKNPSMGASVYTLLRQGGFQYQRVA